MVELRDEILPGVQDDLDEIAVGLRDSLNTLHNQGSATPAPSTLEGTHEGLSGTDTFSATGTLRVAVVDSDGLTVASQDIDLSTITTVDDLLTSLNDIDGVSASLDADGKLILSSTPSSNGLALSGGDISGQDFSSWFGLNDLLVGEGAEDLVVRSDILNSPALLATGSLSDAATLAVGDLALTGGSGSLAQEMADQLTDLGVADTAASIVSAVGVRLEQAKSQATSAETTLTNLSDSFSSKYGVNIDEETARITQLENAYSASAQVLAAVQSMFDDLLEAVQ